MASGNSWIDTDATGRSTSVTHPRFDLRPLSTGEILDRTFQIYRSRFTLFAGLALLPAAVGVVTQALRLWYDAYQRVHLHQGHNLYEVQMITAAMTLVSGVISLILYGITQAATTWAVSAVYLGEEATIKTAYQTAAKHWIRYTLIVLRQVWAGFWLPVILIGTGIALAAAKTSPFVVSLLYFLAFVAFFYAFWAYIRVSLAIPAAVVESLNVNGAIRRSKALLIDRKVRILLLFIFLMALYLVVGAIQAPLAYFAIKARGAEAVFSSAINLALSFVTGTLVGPLGAIAICLFYIDERVRREGFDIEWMMTKVAPVNAPLPIPTDITDPAAIPPAP